MREMASEELGEVSEEENRLRCLLLKSLLPKDDADERDCILEVRAGYKYNSLFYSSCFEYKFISFIFSYERNGLIIIDLVTFLQELEGKKLLYLRWRYLKCRLLTYCCYNLFDMSNAVFSHLRTLSFIYIRYDKYSQMKGWKFEVLNVAESDLKGYKVG